MGEMTTQEMGLRFAELICADDDWLRAEFDALVLAGFGAPPGWPCPPAPPRAQPPGPPARAPDRLEQLIRFAPADIARALRGRCRQRSPPRVTACTAFRSGPWG